MISYSEKLYLKKKLNYSENSNFIIMNLLNHVENSDEKSKKFRLGIKNKKKTYIVIQGLLPIFIMSDN